jgi:uracil-DNA glycosylase
MLLREMIRFAGLRRTFITNLVRCNPRDGNGRNRDPSTSEITNCRDYLEAELAFVQPQIVACLGRVAWRELAGRSIPFKPLRADPLRVDGLCLYPLYHPAYVNRGAYLKSAYKSDFVRLAKILNHTEPPLTVRGGCRNPP